MHIAGATGVVAGQNLPRVASGKRAVERERLIERVFQVLEAYALRD